MYIDIEYYQELYGEVDPFVFDRFCYEAQTKLDQATTSIFGVKRLKEFFPTDEDDAERVKRCLAKITNILISANEQNEEIAKGGFIQSVNSGSESITYANKKELLEVTNEQLSRDVRNTINEYLSGVTDVNGINLLYGGN